MSTRHTVPPDAVNLLIYKKLPGRYPVPAHRPQEPSYLAIVSGTSINLIYSIGPVRIHHHQAAPGSFHLQPPSQAGPGVLAGTLRQSFPDYIDSLYELQENDRLFPITKYYLEHEMQRGIKESGVKRIRVHDLRHSHASMLIELGFSPLEIANRLGHEKVETTLNTYAHLYPNKQTKLAERLDSEYRGNLY